MYTFTKPCCCILCCALCKLTCFSPLFSIVSVFLSIGCFYYIIIIFPLGVEFEGFVEVCVFVGSCNGVLLSFLWKKERKASKPHSIVLTPSWVNNQSKEAKKAFTKHILHGTKNHCNIFLLPFKVIHPCVYQALQSSSIGALLSSLFAFVSYLSTWLMGPHPPPSIYPRDPF
jgi:hypothetical protein